jgi:hypothetical protein
VTAGPCRKNPTGAPNAYSQEPVRTASGWNNARSVTAGNVLDTCCVLGRPIAFVPEENRPTREAPATQLYAVAADVNAWYYTSVPHTDFMAYTPPLVVAFDSKERFLLHSEHNPSP